MRTSHLEIKRRIKSKVEKISGEELFASNAYAAFLTDLAEVATKRYRRVPKVSCIWNEEEKDSDIAYTDNRHIHINTANFLTQSFPTLTLKSDSLVGILAHEIGHILYTNFHAISMYAQSFDSGVFYPYEPVCTNKHQLDMLDEITCLIKDEDELLTKKMISTAGNNIVNILEDVYIEARICDAYPGTFRSGVILNNIRYAEIIPTIAEMINDENSEYSTLINTIIYYCKTGEINNPDNYKGTILDILNSCITIIDNAVYDDDYKTRYDAANQIIIRAWPLLKTMIKEIQQKIDSGEMTLEEALGEFSNQIEEETINTSKAPTGKTGAASGIKKFKFDPDVYKEISSDIQEVVDYEKGRIEREKTENLSEPLGGSINKNYAYGGSGYPSSADDISRMLNNIAEEKIYTEMEEERTLELQEESDKIRYGDIHRGVNININRMSYVDDSLTIAYQSISPALLRISERLSKKFQEILKDKKQGGKLNNLLLGKRLNVQSLVRNDGHIFYNRKLPENDIPVAISLLVDESGSMCSNDRITSARATAIIIDSFCEKLGIPLMIYGHSTGYNGYSDSVELYSYREFDSIDKRDKYRLMDITSRGANRDGAALRFVLEQLLKRSEENKVCILISDGQPADTGYSGTEAEADLRGIKSEYSKKGIVLFSAAIGEDKEVIRNIYKDGFLDISDVNMLPLYLTKLISRYIK